MCGSVLGGGCGHAAEVAVFEPVAVAVQGDDLGVVDKPVDHGGGDDVQAVQLGRVAPVNPAGVVAVALFQALAGVEAGRSDPSFAAVRLPSGDLALQTHNQELPVAPRLIAVPGGQARHRFAQSGAL